MKTKIITLISVLVLSCLATFADGKTGVYLSKDADYDYATQKGTITLENYVGQVTKMIHLNQSADIVLVVDGSSSMVKSKDLIKEALQPAINAFASTLIKACNGTVKHRLSLIVFGNDAKLLCDFTELSGMPETSTYFGTLLYDNCTYKTSSSYVGEYCYSSGGTMTHMALGLADYVMTGVKDTWKDTDAGSSYTWYNNWNLNSITPGGARTDDNVSHYVVLMTDGALENTPSKGTSVGSASAAGTAQIAAMAKAVEVSYGLKHNSTFSSNIYTIGFLADDTSPANQKIICFLNNVSSNYLDFGSPATYAYNSHVDNIAHDYNAFVDSDAGDASEALVNMFSIFSSEIADGCAAITFDESTTTVTDVLNNSYFKLPEGASASDIKIYTIPCTGYDATTRVYSFETDETRWGHPTVGSGTTDIHVDVNESTGTVEVTNFKFSDDYNWCGMKYDTETSTMKANGRKLVIEIPFEVKEFSQAIGTVPTNAEGSGFTGKTDATPQENFSQKFTSPEVDLYELNVTRSGLKSGESAIFTVTDEGGNDIYTIVLIGDGGTVSQKMLFVPAGKITVTETMWNSSTKVTKFTDPVISATNSHPTISFTGSSLGIKEDAKSNLYNK